MDTRLLPPPFVIITEGSVNMLTTTTAIENEQLDALSQAAQHRANLTKCRPLSPTCAS
jgi:hypothetical protein